MKCETCGVQNRNLQFDGDHRVINAATNNVVESHPCIHLARRAAGTLNDHEIRNGRVPCYVAELVK